MCQWDTVNEYHVVPVHRAMCKYTIIPSSTVCPTEPTYTSNPPSPSVREPPRRRLGGASSTLALESALLSTLEPESAYIAFNLNLVSELAPLHDGAGAAGRFTRRR